MKPAGRAKAPRRSMRSKDGCSSTQGNIKCRKKHYSRLAQVELGADTAHAVPSTFPPSLSPQSNPPPAVCQRAIYMTNSSIIPHPHSVDDTLLAACLLEGARAQQRPRLWPRLQASARAATPFLHLARRHPQGAESIAEGRGALRSSSGSTAGVLVGVPGAGGEDEVASSGVGEEQWPDPG